MKTLTTYIIPRRGVIHGFNLFCLGDKKLNLVHNEYNFTSEILGEEFFNEFPPRSNTTRIFLQEQIALF